MLLGLLAPLLVLAAMAVRLTSRGPVIFSQPRVGRGGSQFTIYKLRTMVVADGALGVEDVGAGAPAGALTKMRDDPRVTRVGRFLRRTSVDELPQLLNVLIGEMSLVGPRPLLPFMLDPFPDLRRRRSVMRPGITGLWQVSEREDNTSALAMADADLYYVERFSLGLDLRIMAATIPAAIRGGGAF